MQKRIIEKGFYGVCCACLIWVGASVANVDCHNLTDCNYAKWNAFNLVKLVSAKTIETDDNFEFDDEANVEATTQNEEPGDNIIKQTQRCNWVSTMAQQKYELQVTDANVAKKEEKKAAKRAAKQAAKEEKFQEDVLKLAQVMMAENGQNEEAAILTGVVVLKRVKSEYFPDTIADVIAQPGQYDAYRNGSALTIEPNEMCMECAEELLRFNLADDYPDNLLFQAEFKQGSGVYRQIGNQYFCLT